MKLLLTNDDGIDAPGLEVLERTVREWGEVIVVAPAEAQSGVGLPLFVPGKSPAVGMDCRDHVIVAIAINVLSKHLRTAAFLREAVPVKRPIAAFVAAAVR